MNLEFYTDEHQFAITEDSISKNGELIAKGNVFVFYLMLGYPAWLIVNGNAFCPPQIIKTKPVTSILPHYEVYDGEINPEKQVYEVDFTVCRDGRTLIKKYSCVTVDPLHAIEFVQARFPEAVISSTHLLKAEEQDKSLEKGFKLCL